MNRYHLPKVSVYIPTHNRLVLLKRAINSVLSQNYKNIEIIVSDDGSSDGTEKYMSDISSEKENVIYTRSDSPRGACVARNRAIELASGEFVTGLDDDDFFENNRIDRFVEKILLYDSLGVNWSFLYGDASLINGNIKKSIKRKSKVNINDLCFRNFVGNQIFVRKKHLLSVGCFDEEMPAWQDYDLWFRLCSKYGDAFLVMDSGYNIDISHESNRVSSSISRIKSAYKRFSEKHTCILSKSQNLLYLNVLHYCRKEQSMDLKNLFSYMKNCRKIEHFVFLLKVYLRYKLRDIRFISYKPAS